MTAKETYKKKKKEINEQIKTLQHSLETHSQFFKGNEKNWGYVGDLAHIKSLLIEINSFLA
jgi:hypothetical protein